VDSEGKEDANTKHVMIFMVTDSVSFFNSAIPKPSFQMTFQNKKGPQSVCFFEPSIASSRGFCKAGRLWERHQGDRLSQASPPPTSFTGFFFPG
jgi:hypothetical protein